MVLMYLIIGLEIELLYFVGDYAFKNIFDNKRNKTKVICANLLDFDCDLDLDFRTFLDFVTFQFW